MNVEVSALKDRSLQLILMGVEVSRKSRRAEGSTAGSAAIATRLRCCRNSNLLLGLDGLSETDLITESADKSLKEPNNASELKLSMGGVVQVNFYHRGKQFGQCLVVFLR